MSSTRRSAGAVSSRATNAKAASPARSSRAAAAAASKGRGPSGPPGAAGKGKGKGKGKKKKVKIVEDPKDVRKLLAAAETDDVDTIKAMLELKEKERKVDIKAATGGEALQRAVVSGKRNAVSALMSFGVRPEVNDGRAFQTAAAQNALPLVELLLQREAENKVLDAAERARLIRLKKLRRKKKKQTAPTPLVNLPSTTLELTALHHAAMTGNIPVMAHLIRNKANINAQTHADNCGIYNGWTPLHFAADNGHLGAVRYLYQHGANLELPTHEGETACVLAAESGRFEVMKWLLSQGVDPRVPRRGLEAAQWAIYRGHTDAAEFAIGYGGLPELNQRQVWFPPRFSLKDVVVSEFSEALCRRVDTAVYKGEVKYRERLFRRDQIDDTRWLVDVYNPRELDPDKAVATAVERFPKHIVTLIWLFEIEHTPW